MKKVFAILLILALSVSLVACGQADSGVPEPSNGSSAAVPVSEPDPRQAGPYPLPEQISDVWVDGADIELWTDEEIEYAKSVGYWMTEEETALHAEFSERWGVIKADLQDTNFSHYWSEEATALQQELESAIDTDTTGRAKYQFTALLTDMSVQAGDWEGALLLGEDMLDSEWRSGKWNEGLSRYPGGGGFSADAVRIFLSVANVHFLYGDIQSAIECAYGAFGVNNQAGVVMPQYICKVIFSRMLSLVRQASDPSYLDASQSDLNFWIQQQNNAIERSGEDSPEATSWDETIEWAESRLQMAKESMTAASELEAMIAEDIEELGFDDLLESPTMEIPSITVGVPYFPNLEMTMTDIPKMCGEVDFIPGILRQIKFYYGENTTVSFNYDMPLESGEIIEAGQVIRVADYASGTLSWIVNVLPDGTVSVSSFAGGNEIAGGGDSGTSYMLTIVEVQFYQKNVDEGYAFTDIREWEI